MSHARMSSLLDTVVTRTVAIENYIKICRLFDEAKEEHEKHGTKVLPAGQWCCTLMQRLSPNLDWSEERIFRHRNIVIQLYSIYEWFSEEALTQWLAQLPRNHKFVDLPSHFRNAYRNGISRAIRDIGKGRYKYLDLGDVLEKYSKSVQGDSSWDIVDEALVVHDWNLRRSEFVNLFSGAGLENIWPSLEKSTSIVEFISEIESDKSLEQMILDLVEYRNDANHGLPDEIIGLEELREWLQFVVAFCKGLAEIIVHRMVAAHVKKNPDAILGLVTEKFSNNIVVVRCDRGEFEVGESLYFLREKDCSVVEIQSIQLDDVDKPRIQVSKEGTEIGLKISAPVAINAQVLKFSDT